MVKHGVVVLPPAGMSLLDRLEGSAISFGNCGGALSLLRGDAHALDGLEGRTGFIFAVLLRHCRRGRCKFLEVALGCPEPKFPTTR